MILAHRIRELRLAARLSQADVEHSTGLRRQYVSRVESGRTLPSVHTLEKMAAALGVPLYRFFYSGEVPPGGRRFPHPISAYRSANDAMTRRVLRAVQRLNRRDRYVLLAMARKLSCRVKRRNNLHVIAA